jgi:type IV/VI secretion system ImpK/VasF family protein
MTDAFADLVMPIFHRVINLQNRLSRGEPKTLDEVMHLTRAWIDEAGRRVAANPELKRSFDRARYGLVAWIDETLTNSEWGRSTGWGSEEHVLEWFMFKSRGRAYLFYQHSDDTEAHGDMDALEVYLLCVTLGFVGEHVYDPEQLTAWVERVYGRVSEASSVASKPFPEEDGGGAGFGPLGGPSLLVTVSILFAVTALFTLAAYLFAVHYSYNPTG